MGLIPGCIVVGEMVEAGVRTSPARVVMPTNTSLVVTVVGGSVGVEGF